MKATIILLGLLAGPLFVLAEQETRGSLKRENLVGIWVPTKESMHEIEAKTPNRMPPEIELRSQGSFAVLNIPAWWQNVFGQPSGRFRGINGAHWKIQNGKEQPELLLQDQAHGVSMVLGIENGKPPHFLLLYIGGTTDKGPVRFYRKSGELNPPNRAAQSTSPTRSD